MFEILPKVIDFLKECQTDCAVTILKKNELITELNKLTKEEFAMREEGHMIPEESILHKLSEKILDF